MYDPRTDLFSLGCVLFECLTGTPAFEGTHPMAVLAKLLLQETPHVRQRRADVPEVLDELVARMMAKDPEQRPRAPPRSPRAGAAPPHRGVVGGVAAGDALHGRGRDREGGVRGLGDPSSASLTMREKRFVSIVLAGDPDADESRPGPRLPLDELRKAIAPFGGQISLLCGDSLIATLWGPGAPSIAPIKRRSAR